jgi:hypothetical protein
LHPSWTEDYDTQHMDRRWLPVLRSSVAVLVLLSLSFVLVHWHPDKSSQDCGLCYAHQMPGLQIAGHSLVTGPNLYVWRLTSCAPVFDSHAFVPAHPGRAPPRSLSSI